MEIGRKKTEKFRRVMCKDCGRGVICPDWDPPEGWCTAGVRK